MKRSADTLLIGKNRQRAAWSLAMISLALLVSGSLLYLGLRGGRGGIGWMLALIGMAGLAAFAWYGALVIRTMRSHWHLAINRLGLSLHTPTYELHIPWEQVLGIAVGEVHRRLGCVLVFDDIAAVAGGAVFHTRLVPAGSVTGAASMEARMADSFRQSGFHLGIPGRILELGPEALAELLTQARTGQLWREG